MSGEQPLSGDVAPALLAELGDLREVLIAAIIGFGSTIAIAHKIIG